MDSPNFLKEGMLVNADALLSETKVVYEFPLSNGVEVIKYETFDPPFVATDKETNGFTAGKEYPIYGEIVADTTILEPRVEKYSYGSASSRSIAIKETEENDGSQQKTFAANHTVMYLTINDNHAMVLKSSAYFKLYAHADIYEHEKQEEAKTKEPIQFYIAQHKKLIDDIFGYIEKQKSPIKEYLKQHQKLVDAILNKKEE